MALRILGGRWKGRLLHTPPDAITRPTQSLVRAALFNICQTDIEGARVLDLFAGSGAIGLEALSRGATSSLFVEVHPKAARVIRQNLEQFAIGKEAFVLEMDVLRACRWLLSRSYRFDLIYMDAPYHKSHLTRELLREVSALLAHSGKLFVEEQKGETEALIAADVPLIYVKSRTFGGSMLHQFIPGDLPDVPST